MDRGWYLRFIFVLGIAIAGWLALWPSVDTWVPAPDFVKNAFAGRISPGLDIKGGLRLMYEVEVEEAINDRRDRLAEQIQRRIGAKLGVLEDDEVDSATREQLAEIRELVRVQKVAERDIRLTFERDADADRIDRQFLDDHFPDLGLVGRQGKVMDLSIREERLEQLRDDAVQQAARTISNRIDELQIRETSVIARDTDIIIEIPGADEASFDRIRSIISRTARLEFKILDDDGSSAFINGLADLPEGVEKRSEPGLTAGAGNTVTGGYLSATGEDAKMRLQQYIEGLQIDDEHQLALGRVDGNNDDEEQVEWRTYYLFAVADVTGEDIKDAFVTQDQQENNKPVVAVHFHSEGAERFEELTGRNIKRRMAIVLDAKVESAPVIQARIGGGRAQITLGSFQDYNELLYEARDLVVVLKAGALPAPIRPANEQLIGPTLGRDSIMKGAEGGIIGVILVLLFMAFYYQVAGLVADVMVMLNILLLLACLAFFEATLTLPGVAGIALTVGMAVDANVLITERIREELRLGKSPRSAVDQGFSRAFSSIFDSQLTTFIAGVVLFQYGTGPIKGFAVTLMIGIGTSLFTGVFCSKVLLDWIVRGLRVQRLRVG